MQNEIADMLNMVGSPHMSPGEEIGATVYAMLLMLETRDPYTATHQRRVAALARVLAQEIGLSDIQQFNIHTAGLLHDIGKASIPVEILNKPGMLSEAEFTLVRNHPAAGYEILEKIGFEKSISNAVLQHHERLDGSGYPQGLSGDEITLEARILAVADVVEAMCSHRPYRPAPGLECALNELVQKKGVCYDSDVVDFCRILLTDNEHPEKFAIENRIFTPQLPEAGFHGYMPGF